jgi:hypothetical protein
MNPVLAYVQRDLDLKRQEMDEAKDRFNGLITRLEEGGVSDASALSEKIEEQSKVLDALAEESVSLAWDAFRELHPEEKNIPAPMRAEFASAAQNMHALFGDKPNMLHMIRAAYEFAAWKTKTDTAALRNPVQTPVAIARSERQGRPVIAASPEAQRQALVADTGMAYSHPRRNIDAMSMDDILDQNDKWLDNL